MIPSYDALPELGTLGIKHSWGVLPPALGTLSFLTERAVRAAAHEVQTGETVSLSVAFAEFQPPLFGRQSLTNVISETERNIFEDCIGSFNPQASSQWDGLTHVRAREHGFYSGITDTAEAAETLGMHHWAARGIAGRGVLVDVAGHRAAQKRQWDPFAGDVVDHREIEEILRSQNVSLAAGDILCIRLGWLAEFRRRATAGSKSASVGDRFSGIASTHEMARFLWDHHVAAVCADNPAIESAPGDPKNGSLHRRLIPGLGFALAELLDFEVLARRCAERASYSFLFTAAPLAIVGAASSTANALAIV